MRTLVVCGATATGKTALAVGCAHILNAEIISADSQTIYRGMDIGTAKPTLEEMEGVPHHMIDVADPSQEYSVEDYRRAAKKALEMLDEEGKTAIICGGAMFYINSLLFDYSYGEVPKRADVRERYERMAEENGRESVYEILKEKDPETAAKLHPNDLKRVVRALEMCESGKKKSELRNGTTILRDYLAVAVDYPRDVLYRRIDDRVDEMFAKGLVEEVKGLLDRGLDERCQSMQAIGYKEVIEGLKCGYNECSMRDKVKLNTRHYAKRQITFFKKLPGLVWLRPEDATAENIARMYDGTI